MPYFHPEPKPSQHPKTGVLLINLGSPSAPTAAALRPYLRDFLSDTRVIELPRWKWQPILRGIILPLRSPKSAHAYRQIWQAEGSPLIVHSERQRKALQSRLPENVLVECAMTYGEPSVRNAVRSLKEQGVNQILAVSMFPQYAASCSGAALDKVFRDMLRQRNQVSLRTVTRFYNHAGYIHALAEHIRRHRKGGHLIFSFHGIPQRQYDLGDPYPDECRETAAQVAAKLGLSERDYTVAYQSRFGNDPWVEPCTQDLFDRLPAQGIKNIDIVCPCFVADCIETLEEIADSGRVQFLQAGGESFNYIPCLNSDEQWLDALSDIVQTHLQGWL